MNDADRDLVRRDPLPGLATLLDAQAFASLAHELFPSVPRAGGAVVYLRYKPSTSCIAAFRAGDGARLYAKATRDANDRKLAKFRAEQERGAAIAIAEDRAIGLAAFPWDVAILDLARIATADATRDLARSVFGRDVSEVQQATLRYKPERRWVGMLTADGERSVVRIFAPKDFDARRVHVTVRPECGVVLSETCGTELPSNTVAVNWIDGGAMSDALAAPDGERAAADTGRALAAFHHHAQASGGLERRSAAMLQSHSRGVADLVGWLLPTLRERVAAQAARITFEEAENEVVLHGDFYASQVLITPDDRIAFIDFDEVARGARWIDVANFIAHLERDALTSRATRVETLRGAFVDAYAAAAGTLVPAELDRYVAAALLALAGEPFRYRQERWPEATESIIDRVDALLDGSGRSRSRDSEPSLVERALDTASASCAFARLPQLRAARVVEARLVRHKASRRALIEYALDDNRRVLGKIRMKGTDARAFALQQALWAAGFGASASDAITVAEPLGIIDEWNMWLQQALTGTTATAAIQRGEPRVGHRAATALAKLHSTTVAPPRRHTAADELTILSNALSGTAGELPHRAAEIGALLADCSALLSSLQDRPTALIHRDFHPDQLILGGDFTALIDLDLAAEGDPAVDVGNFIAHLLELALRTRGDLHGYDVIATEFRDTYTELNPAVSPGAIEVYVIASLARHVAISRRIPSRRAVTEKIIEVSLNLAKGATR